MPLVEVDPSTVCQYTGLKDKGEKEIWEHDLLKVTAYGYPREVTFHKGAYMYWDEPLFSYSIKDGVCELIKVGSKFDKEV